MSSIDKLNDHELVDLKNAIEEERSDALMGQKRLPYYVVSCIAMLRILPVWTTPYVA